MSKHGIGGGFGRGGGGGWEGRGGSGRGGVGRGPVGGRSSSGRGGPCGDTQSIATHVVRDCCGQPVRDKDGNVVRTADAPTPFMGAPHFDASCFGKKGK